MKQHDIEVPDLNDAVEFHLAAVFDRIQDDHLEPVLNDVARVVNTAWDEGYKMGYTHGLEDKPT